jgi:hexosaminidase
MDNAVKKLIFILMIVVSVPVIAQQNIIPQPVHYQATEQHFELNGQLIIQVDVKDDELLRHASQFQSYLQSINVESEIRQLKKTDIDPRVLNLRQAKATLNELGNEGYRLDVENTSISIFAASSTGVFYGLQSLKQLMPPKAGKDTIQIDGCQIEDFPRFQWRGLMLDVSRHFFPVADVKAYIDKMSEYKFNVFHWHLTDDQGWRIEIKSLPRLTEIGAWRVERHGRFGDERPYPEAGEKPTYGGFYSHEDIREIVQYAAERHITIVPEIDMPGHSMAALAAYPTLSVNKEPKFVSPGSKFAEWYDDGTFEMMIENTLNPTDEAVYEFADKVFSEVADLFPGEYIHMGGDEAYQGFWDKDPNVQAFMKARNIEDTHALQNYFVNRIEKIIRSKNKKMIGWDEILTDDLSKTSAVMSWRGMEGGIKAANSGYQVVMTPTTYAYLDYTQGDHSVENSIYASLSLEKTYEFEPLPDDVDPAFILGGQGNLWTEAVPNLPFAFYMTYPRAFALAEVLWSPKSGREWNSFIERTENHFVRFDATEDNISKAIFDPQVEVFYEDDLLKGRISNSIPGTDLYYTIDNTYPPITGTKYTDVFDIPEGKFNLRTQVYRNGKALGRELILSRTVLESRAPKTVESD